MSITTYGELQTAVANWLNRTDLTQRVPEFIALAEARFRRELRDWLRFNLTATSVTGDYTLPATVAEVVSVNYNDGTSGSHNFQLVQIDREKYQSLMDAQSILTSLSGQAVYVDVDQDANTIILRFWPPAGTTAPIANLRIEAIKVLPGLSDTQTTNALLRDASDVYLYGALAESAPYLEHDERLAVWEKRVVEGLRALRVTAERRTFGATPRPRTLARVF